METITEKLSTPVAYRCRTAVAGGGVAGIAAALAAARRGADVMLIEREYAPGGLATLGLVTIYLPICDGRGRQVIYGIGEELLRLSVRHGYEKYYPEAWLEGGTVEEKIKTRFETGFNGPLFAMECEKLLTEAGVRILYGTQICSARRKGDRITHLIAENKSGRFAVACDNVIDATGDADAAAFAGAETALYGKGNILAGWYYSYGAEGRRLRIVGVAEKPDDEEDGDVPPRVCSERFSGVDGDEISRMTVMSHGMTYRDWAERRAADPDSVPCEIASIPQLRMTRRIVGTAEPCVADEGKSFADGIGVIPDWRHRGPVFEIPFGSLRSVNVSNLLAAGRDIGVADDLWDVSRVIPCCALTGEAAGTAAALFGSFDLGAAELRELKKELRASGVRTSLGEL